MAKISRKLEQLIVSDYQGEMNCNQIAKKYNINGTTVKRAILRNGISIKKIIYPTEDIRKEFSSQEKVSAICAKYHISYATMYDICKDLPPRRKKAKKILREKMRNDLLKKRETINHVQFYGVRYLDVTDHLDTTMNEIRNYYHEINY